MSEICDEVKELVEKAEILKNHPLLELARNVFDSIQETLDLKEKLDQERVSRSKIEEQLKQAQRKGEDRERDCERLQTKLEREKEEMSPQVAGGGKLMDTICKTKTGPTRRSAPKAVT